jgi:hypothetical protein
MFALIFFVIIIFTKRPLQILWATKECDNESSKWCFLLKLMVKRKKSDTNKNVTKMGVIIKGLTVVLKISENL